MTQPISRWFNVEYKDKKSTVPVYFHFNMKNNKAEFLLTEPEDVYMLGSLKWKQYKTQLFITCCPKTLFCSERLQLDRLINSQLAKTYNKSHIPILKSCLQKCVRRCLADKAVKTAATILCLDPNQLLRRLPIIIIEDVIINYHVTKLVWLMCAVTKGLLLSDYWLQFIVDLVGDITQYPHREAVTHDKKEFDLRKALKFLDQNGPNKQNRDLLWAVQLRKSYGGMKGDMKMLNGCTRLWLERFVSEVDLDTSDTKIDLTTLGLINPSEIIPAAIDFHCTDILQRVAYQYPEIDPRDIQSAIWFHRSGINKRKIIFGEEEEITKYQEVWEEIASTVDYYSRRIIREKF